MCKLLFRKGDNSSRIACVNIGSSWNETVLMEFDMNEQIALAAIRQGRVLEERRYIIDIILNYPQKIAIGTGKWLFVNKDDISDDSINTINDMYEATLKEMNIENK